MLVSLPVLKDDLIDIRCDRTTCEKKGGVLVYVSSQMHPCNIHRFVTNGIKAVSITLQHCCTEVTKCVFHSINHHATDTVEAFIC